MRYLHSYRFVFDSPKWAVNLLLTAVCSLIPIVGPIVLIGYFFEVVDALLLRRGRRLGGAPSEQVMDALPAGEEWSATGYPDFEFNRFGEYLMRGIWPFLVSFVVGLVVWFLMLFVFIVGFAIAGVASSGTNSPWPILAAYGVFWLVVTAVGIVMGIAMTPIYIRAGLMGDFAGAFSLEFYRDFMKRVGKQTVLAQLFIALSGTVVMPAGILMCFVGVCPAWALIQFAHHHLEYQLYELYLERGGKPVERKMDHEVRRVIEDDDEVRSHHVMRPPRREPPLDVIIPEEDV